MQATTTLGGRPAAGGARDAARVRPLGGLAFDWAMVALSGWGLLGLFADGWAHNHDGATLESFFTPWHAAFYSGVTAVAALTLVALWRNHAAGSPWRAALPDGYLPTLVGEGIFFVGGLGDLLWHELFGIEANVEALLSPTHLTIAVGLGLIVGGPFRAVWRRGEIAGWARQLPMLLSLTFVLSTLTFFLQFAHPFERPLALAGNRPAADTLPLVAPDPALLLVDGALPAADLVQAAGLSGLLLHTTLLAGLLLLVVRRWGARLLPGALTLLVALNALGMAAMRDEWTLVPGALLAGLLAELLLRALRPAAARPRALRLFAAAVPALWAGGYFAALALAGGIWWSVHLWAGAIAMAGIAGWLLSYAFVPPAVPAEERLGPDTDRGFMRVSRKEGEEEYAQRSPG